MYWTMNTLPLPQYVELGVHSLSGLLWTLLLLFLWHCYRIGSDLSLPGHTHAGKLKSNSRRSMISRSVSCIKTKGSTRSKQSRSDQIGPFISMERVKDDEQGQGYLTPVLSHSLFPAQTTAEAKKLYKALRSRSLISSSCQTSQVFLFSHVTLIGTISSFWKPTILSFWRSSRLFISAASTQKQAGRAWGQRYLRSPHTSVLANIHKQQLFGIGGILAAGARSLTGGLLWSHQHTSTLSSRWVKRLSKIHFLTLAGLQTPPLCELVVGGEPQCWSEGHCLLVDDSFLHTISHKGPPESGPRVILSVDLWHPNVAAAERQAFDYMFNPDL